MTSVVVKNFQASNLESKNLTITDNISDVSQLKQVIGESFKLNPKHFGEQISRFLFLFNKKL